MVHIEKKSTERKKKLKKSREGLSPGSFGRL